MADDKKNSKVEENDKANGYSKRRTPGQAEGTVEDVEGGGVHKDTVNPKRPSQAEGEDTEED